MRVSTDVQATRWVGSVSDFNSLVALFEDLQEEVREKVRAQLELTLPKRLEIENARYSYLDEAERNNRVQANLGEHKEKCLDDVKLTLGLTEQLHYPSGNPRDIVRTADLPSTTSFSLSLSTGYVSSEYSDATDIQLNARSYGVTCTITSRDRSLVEGTKARISRELERTTPQRSWFQSLWAFYFIGTAFCLGFYSSLLFALGRIFPSESNLDLWVATGLYLASAVGLQILMGNWRKQFPVVEVVANGGSPRSERAVKTFRTVVGWVVTSIVIPLMIGLALG